MFVKVNLMFIQTQSTLLGHFLDIVYVLNLNSENYSDCLYLCLQVTHRRGRGNLQTLENYFMFHIVTNCETQAERDDSKQ
jgi:hypothetical protein